VLLRFDFAGISLLIAGTAFPCFYYGLYCQMAVATIYLTWTFAAALACFVVCLFEWIHKAGNEKYRSVVFGSFGFSMAVPISHLVINEAFFDNYGDPYEFSSAGVYYAILISCYIVGLYVFTVR
jgi:adiponectin receptor